MFHVFCFLHISFLLLFNFSSKISSSPSSLLFHFCLLLSHFFSLIWLLTFLFQISLIQLSLSFITSALILSYDLKLSWSVLLVSVQPLTVIDSFTVQSLWLLSLSPRLTHSLLRSLTWSCRRGGRRFYFPHGSFPCWSNMILETGKGHSSSQQRAHNYIILKTKGLCLKNYIL